MLVPWLDQSLWLITKDRQAKAQPVVVGLALSPFDGFKASRLEKADHVRDAKLRPRGKKDHRVQ